MSDIYIGDLDFDPVTGVRRKFFYDPYEGISTIQTVQDVEPILEANKDRANAAENSWKGEWYHVASIPMPLYAELQRQGIIDDPDRFRAWLNDRDNRLFRTKPGKV